MRTFTCRVSDLRRVAITCRCGGYSVAEVPQQLASGYMVHPCPKCGAVFEVHQGQDGKWEVKKLSGTIQDAAYVKLEQEATTDKKEN